MGEPPTHDRMNRSVRGDQRHHHCVHMREFGVALHFDWARFSAVKIEYFPHQPELHNVTNDQCGIIRLAMQRVMAMGYRRIGFVMHRGWDHSVDHLWAAGFLCEQQNLAESDRIPLFLFPNAEPVEAWINESKSEVIAPAATFNRWVKKHRPAVIISKASFVRPRFRRAEAARAGRRGVCRCVLEKSDGGVRGRAPEP